MHSVFQYSRRPEIQLHMQNPPTVSTPVRKLLERVDNEQLILPEIQRDSVWQKRSVMLLFDSLFRGLPIGPHASLESQTSRRGKSIPRQEVTNRPNSRK